MQLSRFASLVCCLLVLVSAVAAAGPDRIPITIHERAGVDREAELVRFGVPVPRAWGVTDAGELHLTRGQSHVPAEMTVLARWGGAPADATAPIKWLFVECVVAAAAEESLDLELQNAPAARVFQKPMVELVDPTKLIINTGAARFEIGRTDEFNLIDQVTVDGRRMLASPACRAIRYQPAGERGVVGSPPVVMRPTAVDVEADGPFRTTVLARGSILDDDGTPVLDFTARMRFMRDSRDVAVDFTVENNHPILPDDQGQPVNARDQGLANSVYIGSLSLNLRLAGEEGLFVDSELWEQVEDIDETVEVYQDSSGTDNWDVYVGQVGWPGEERSCHPRAQSFCRRDGFVIRQGDRVLGKGRQSLGWMLASRGELGMSMAAAVGDIWQNFPKALRVHPDGTLSIDLFPNGEQFQHNLRPGEQKTHRIWLSFSADGFDLDRVDAAVMAFNQPLVAVVAPDDVATSGVLCDIPAADVERWPLYERYARVAFEPNPDFDPNRDDPNFGNRTLVEQIGHYNFYGWQDYGDVPLDYEAFGDNQAGQMNLKYWYLQGMLTQFLRSGDPAWMDLALPAARHLSDTDFLHIPDSGPDHWAHGAYFGHSQHDEPGNTNPNRNHNSPSVDLFYGVSDLLLAYYITGDPQFAETAMEGVVSMRAMSEFSWLSSPVFERERANMILGYMAAYRHTGDQQWLDELRKIVASVTDIANKTWLTDHAAFGRDHPDEYLSTFQYNQVCWALGLYLDFCAEYGIEDDLGVVKALAAYGDFTIEVLMQEFEPGRVAMPHHFLFDGSDNPEGYLEINNWALTAADALAYAFKYTGQKKYLDAAARFYTTGVTDQVWQDDAPVYLSSKDLVNTLNWGLVYMGVSRQ